MPTALIVEDEPEANKLLGMLLRLRGYKTVSAYTGEEALRLVDEAQPDVVLLDLMLPDLNGYEICKILKSSKVTSLIPLVIITARIEAENRIESFCIGADDYIAKPYTPDRIFQAVDQALVWSSHSASCPFQASIHFGGSDDGEIFRRLGQLRSALFARSTLSQEDVTQIDQAIKEIWNLAAEWRKRSADHRDTVLTYTLTDEALTLEFRDAQGWLGRIPILAKDPSSGVHAARFDHVDVDESDRAVRFNKRLPAPENTSID